MDPSGRDESRRGLMGEADGIANRCCYDDVGGGHLSSLSGGNKSGRIIGGLIVGTGRLCGAGANIETTLEIANHGDTGSLA